MALLRLLFLVAVGCTLCKAQDEVETVDELIVGKYLGFWYQMYASPIVYATFEEDGVCITATYGVYNESVLTVYNHMRILTPTGPVDEIDGFAYTTDEAGKLFVELDGTGFDAPYWVVKLGPATFGAEGQYEYSIVTDPFRLFLFVLARDIQVFEAQYENEVLNWLYSNGFDSPLNYPIKTFHNEFCLYPEDDQM